MKKIIQEFKAFINKGSVLDLAVGMIIGSAFTSIVNSLVNNILKPLINWIPVSAYGFQTVLKEAVVDDAGNVVSAALVIDWGAVFSAIITFFLTAIVLFLIVKFFNKAKETTEKARLKLEKEAKEMLEKKKKEDGDVKDKSVQETETIEETKESETIEETKDPEATEIINDTPKIEESTSDLLKKIISLLEEKK